MWSGLPFAPLGNLPNPGLKPATPASPALTGIIRIITTEPPGKCKGDYSIAINISIEVQIH